MGSNPIIGTLKNATLLGRSVRIRVLICDERSRKKTHENTAYLPSNRQISDYDLP